jgi:hypothetical protein
MATFDATVSALTPLGWWKLNDAVNATTAADSSGNSNTGTVHGTVTFGQSSLIPTNPSGTGALFDGSTGYISLPNASVPATGGAMSIMATFQPIGAADGAIFSIRTSPNSYYNCLVFTSGSGHGVVNTPCWQVSNSTFTSYFPPSLALGYPVQIVATLDASQHLIFYANGQKVYATTVGAMSGTVNTPAIGSTSGGGAGVLFHGVMNEVATFGAVLTPSQVTSLYQAAFGTGQLLGLF